MSVDEVNVTGSTSCSTRTRLRRRAHEMARIKEAIGEILEADRPMTVRQVFYQLVVRNVIEKTEMEYAKTASRLLTDMRKNGEIPFSWISDHSRRRFDLRSFDNIADAVDECAKFYRRNAMRQSDCYIEISVEKEALSGIVWDVASVYGVPVVASKGMPSITQLYQTACMVKRAADTGKPTYIYQFGDWDPTGLAIAKNIREGVSELCVEKLNCTPPNFERIGLTLEQITEFDLPSHATKFEGNHHAKGFVGDSVELDALPVAELRSLVRECIEWHISSEELEILGEIEGDERNQLKIFARKVRRDQEDDATKVKRFFGEISDDDDSDDDSDNDDSDDDEDLG